MLRQCFFPSSYKRRSSNSIKPPNAIDKDSKNSCSFVKRLDLSCRRPARSEVHLKSSNQNQCYTQCQEEAFDAFDQKKQSESIWKSIYSKRKTHETKFDKNKLIFDFDKKQLNHTKQIKRKSTHLLTVGISKRVGMSQIKNQDFSWKPLQKQRINMTERMKGKQRRQPQNVIMGWEYYEDTDPMF